MHRTFVANCCSAWVRKWPIASMLACLPLSRSQGLSGHDQLGRIRLIAPGLLRFRRWTGNTPFSATHPAGWRIYPSTRSGRLNRRCESSAVAGVASHFHGSRFLLSHAAGRTINRRRSENTIDPRCLVKLELRLTNRVKLTCASAPPNWTRPGSTYCSFFLVGWIGSSNGQPIYKIFEFEFPTRTGSR
jgi:hypothetical protein